MDLHSLLGDEADALLGHQSKGITKDELTAPGPDFIDRVLIGTDRSPAFSAVSARSSATAAWAGPATSRSCRSTRASSTRRAASFAHEPRLLRPAEPRRARDRGRLQRGGHHVRGAGGRRGATRTDPVHRQAQPQRAAHLPEQVDQVMFGSAAQAHDSARSGSAPRSTSARRSRPVRLAGGVAGLREAHQLGMFTCSGATCATTGSRRTASTTHVAADLTGQANHLGVTIKNNSCNGKSRFRNE